MYILTHFVSPFPISEGLLERVSRLVAINTIHAIYERSADLGNRLFLSEAVISKLSKVVENGAMETEEGVSPKTNAIDTSDALELLSAEELHSTLEFVTEVGGVIQFPWKLWRSTWNASMLCAFFCSYWTLEVHLRLCA